MKRNLIASVVSDVANFVIVDHQTAWAFRKELLTTILSVFRHYFSSKAFATQKWLPLKHDASPHNITSYTISLFIVYFLFPSLFIKFAIETANPIICERIDQYSWRWCWFTFFLYDWIIFLLMITCRWFFLTKSIARIRQKSSVINNYRHEIWN